MKTISLKIVIAAIFIVVISLGASAQIGRGGSCVKPGICATGTTTCTPATQLTVEQITILNNLYVEFQAQMDILRSALQSTRSFTEKLAIRQEMVDLKNAHIAEVKALLEEWGIR
jgi:hypothetical protein